MNDVAIELVRLEHSVDERRNVAGPLGIGRFALPLVHELFERERTAVALVPRGRRFGCWVREDRGGDRSCGGPLPLRNRNELRERFARDRRGGSLLRGR